MRLGPASVAELARNAGFVWHELPTVTAIALVASGGHPHYDFPTGVPGAGRYVGLWGIDADQWPEFPSNALFDPQGAARAAYTLTERCNGFGWSAHWRAGADKPYRVLCAQAAAMPAWQDRQYAPIVSDVYRPHTDNLRASHARRLAEMALWPQRT